VDVRSVRNRATQGRLSRRRSAPLLVVAIALLSAPRAGAVGPDAFGYRSLQTGEEGSPPYLSFVDISTTGTRLEFVDADDVAAPNADDGVALALPLGALNGGRGFPFYGTFRTTVAMSTNGYLDFEPSGASDLQTNQCPLPDPIVPNTLIAALWDDLVLANPPDPARGGYQEAFSACPYSQGGDGACVIFQWHNADHLTGSADAFSFQAVLYEGGNVLVNFAAGNLEEGINSTTGIEHRGLIGVTAACDLAASIPAESAVLFLAPAITAATVGELEPNDSPATPTPLPAGRCGAGVIGAAGDADVWSVTGPGAVLYTLVDTQLALPSTTSSLRVLAADGTELAADTDSGPGAGSALAGVALPAPGALVRIGEVGDNATLAPYLLTAFAVSPLDRAPENEPNDDPGTADGVSASRMSGTLDASDADFFAFQVESIGDTITVMADADPDGDGLLSGVALGVFGPDDVTPIATSEPGARRPVAVRLLAPTFGTYSVRVTQLPGGADDDYEVVVLRNCASACGDLDGDARCNAFDNCLAVPNDQSDADADGVGDACDRCVGHDDANGNEIPDCLVNEEFRRLLWDLSGAVDALARGMRRDDPAVLLVRTLLEDVRAFLAAKGASLTVTGDVDVASLGRAVLRRVPRASKTRKPRFARSRRKATEAISAFGNALVPET
jgi:hypothetical protein